MKRFLSYLQKITVFAVVLVLVFSPMFGLFTTPVAQAVFYCYKGDGTYVNKADANDNCSTAAGYASYPIDVPAGENVQSYGFDSKNNTDLATKDRERVGGGPETECGFSSFTGVAHCLASVVYVFTVGLGTGVAYIGSYFLNFAVHLSLNSSAYALDFVSQGWTTARDVANMAFIFILIYIALTIIFRADTSHTMQILTQVIFIALIINFSFFFVRVVIDVGNIFAVQFYNAATEGAPTMAFGFDGGTSGIPDLTANIMNGLDLQKAFNTDTFQKFAADNNTPLGALTYLGTLSFLYIAMGAMLFMLAAAFLAAGVKFLVRIVVLWFCIIAAPLALVARTIHQFEGYYKTWQKNLIAHVFYPVVFLFIFWIISQFMDSISNGEKGGLVSAIFSDVNSTNVNGFQYIATVLANIGIRLGFVIVMLYIGLKASEAMGVYGAKAAESFGNTFSLGGLTGYRQRLDWVNNTVGPKRWAGGLDNQLAVGKLSRVGNTALGYNLLRKPITKPLAEFKLKDMESRPEYVKRSKKEFDERVENIKHKAEHPHEGPAAEQREQRKFRQEYEGGPQVYDNRLKELTHAIESSKEESITLQRELVELQGQSLERMDDAQRVAHRDAIAQKTQAIKTNANVVKNNESQLKTLTGMSHRIVETRNKQHTQEIAVKLASSRSTVRYLAGQKILIGKSSKDKLAEAAKAMVDEDRDGDHPPAGGAGAPNHPAGRATAGATPPAATPGTHPPEPHN